MLDSVRSCLFRMLVLAAILVHAGPALAFEFLGFVFDRNGIHRKSAESTRKPAAGALQYTTTIQTGNAALDTVIAGVSLLVSDQAEPVEETIGLLSRARVDQKRIIAALYGEAYYGAVLNIFINDIPLDELSLERDFAGAPVEVKIIVEAGPQFVFSRPVARAAGRAVDLAPHGIVPGAVARSELILTAQEEILTAWRDRGHAFAALESRTIEADHRSKTLDVELEFETGPVAHVGAVQVAGAEMVSEQTILHIADLHSGNVYSPRDIKRATRKLQDLGVFNTVVIKTEKSEGAEDRVDLVIEVSERKPRTIGAGVTAGNLDGLGVEAFWTHRNLFGEAEKLRLEGSLGRIGRGSLGDLNYRAAAIFSKPDVFDPRISFEGKASFAVENSDAYEKKGGKVEAGLNYQMRDWLSVKGGLAAEYAVVTDETGTTRSTVVSAPFELTYDTRDNTLDPSRGIHASVLAEPTHAFDSQATFIKTAFNGSTYFALDEEKMFILAGRLAAGSIFGASLARIPVDRRFFVGGGGSLRGYAYQFAGPVTAKGKPSGGLSFIEASLELRYKINEQFGLVGFIDTGGAFASNTPGQGDRFYTGAGVGVRYITPLGPLRLDIAIPLDKISGQPKYGLYFGVGQAF